MNEERRKEIIRMQNESMRAMTEEEIWAMQRKAAPGLRALSSEEIAERQAEGTANIYQGAKLPGEA